MGTFAFAAAMLGFTDGRKKIPGRFRRKVMARGESISSLWMAFKTQKKIDRIPKTDFLAHYCPLGGRKSVPVPAAASFKDPC